MVSLDPTNGLDRSADSGPLVAHGRSLTESSIQRRYRNYTVALDTIVHPDYFSVGSETNLIRAVAPGGGYVGITEDLADFPFIQALGISSHSHLTGWADPDRLPADYFSRFALGSSKPVLIIEGGWSSTTVQCVTTTAEM